LIAGAEGNTVSPSPFANLVNKMWVCIGHSHALALARGAEQSGVALDAINFWWTGEPWVREAAGVKLRPDLAERVEQGQLVLSLIGGSAHTVLGMVEHPRPFDFVLPSEPDLPTDITRELVPAEAVRAKLIEMSAEYLATVPVLLGVATGPVIQLEPPPPIADADRIIPHVPWGFFPGQPRLVAPKWLRYKLWRLHSEVIAAACAAFGVSYRPVPNRAKDGEGFLNPRYDEDGAHANAAYGALVLDDLGRAA
jgi:hypothetical protein